EQDPDSDLPEAAQRILASRRRELEREFDVKRTDLKTQHQRRVALLEQEKADWLEHRRRQAKELADKTEKTRRRLDNAQQRAETGAATLKELEERRAQVKALEQGEREAARRQARLEADVALARERLRSARARSSAAAAVLVLGALAWLAAGWRAPLGAALLATTLASAFLLAASAGRGGSRSGQAGREGPRRR
ncbi:MAG: hypothetical protein LC623_05315, partial [Halobacteriales archaeon]|nr:hypothetical protein [Halobacteriales archaeon]